MFSGKKFIKSPVSNFTEILPVGAVLIHADIRTDMLELTSVFRKTANAQGTAFESHGASN